MKEVKKEFCWFSITEYEKEEDIFCDDQSRLELLNRIFENREEIFTAPKHNRTKAFLKNFI